MKKLVSLLILYITLTYTYGNNQGYAFRLKLKDKGKSAYSTDNPMEFLSSKAIERRTKQHIPITLSDIPINEAYLQEIEQKEVTVIAKSKWMNTVVVYSADSTQIEELKKLPFVISVSFVWKGDASLPVGLDDSTKLYQSDTIERISSLYGKAEKNIMPNNGEYLHDKGFRGKGIDIAVIDGGFSNMDRIEMLANVSMKGSKGFVYGIDNLFNNKSQHGLCVLSCMATNMPHQYVGTAPEAAYWLLGSEDSRSEYPIEQDYWAAAVEYADSVGADIVSSSLGYHSFDNKTLNINHQDLDGKAVFISQVANEAARKGMLVVCSAGNSGSSEWKKITPPADADNILTVGAIQSDSSATKFSSLGFTADLRVKPDVMALGYAVAVIDNSGKIAYLNGTSFSTPIVAGLAACLWQAYPNLTNKELLNVIRQASSRYDYPDDKYGYGIPDMRKAMNMASEIGTKN